MNYYGGFFSSFFGGLFGQHGQQAVFHPAADGNLVRAPERPSSPLAGPVAAILAAKRPAISAAPRAAITAGAR